MRGERASVVGVPVIKKERGIISLLPILLMSAVRVREVIVLLIRGKIAIQKEGIATLTDQVKK